MHELLGHDRCFSGHCSSMYGIRLVMAEIAAETSCCNVAGAVALKPIRRAVSFALVAASKMAAARDQPMVTVVDDACC